MCSAKPVGEYDDSVIGRYTPTSSRPSLLDARDNALKLKQSGVVELHVQKPEQKCIESVCADDIVVHGQSSGNIIRMVQPHKSEKQSTSDGSRNTVDSEHTTTNYSIQDNRTISRAYIDPNDQSGSKSEENMDKYDEVQVEPSETFKKEKKMTAAMVSPSQQQCRE